MPILYVSTRGSAPVLGFEEAVLTGLAPDGGLYLPERLPEFSPAEIASWAGLPYAELAHRLLSPFTEGALSGEELRDMLEGAYGEFRHNAVAPLKQLANQEFVLELFHGPTLAFKDFALQFLGRLMGHLLARRGERATVLGATSGDTGSAAIAGFRGRENLRIFILHPEGRVSDVQRRQMTTVADANVHNLAVKGNFDDCQDIVKALFSDAEFRASQKLVAVNSINWARILAQVVYYFYAALHLGAPARAVSFSVPTGNFGDIYAGYLAKRMGLPVARLLIASNRNDILTRCLNTGEYRMQGVSPSLSPSMDIQISSNFERLLFDLHDRSGERIAALMADLRKNQCLTLSAPLLSRLRAEFDAAAVSDEETTETIRRIYRETGELLDPHTAVGVAAARRSPGIPHVPRVTLATAHPAKFPDAVQAATGIHPALPAHLADIFSLPERLETVENQAEAVKKAILAAAG